MRSRGNYIVDKRLKFKRGYQRLFFEEIKKYSKRTWQELADELGISYHTLNWDWYSEKSTIPKNFAKKLIKKYPFKEWEYIYNNWVVEELVPKWGQIKAGLNREKKILIPPISEKLAEFLGAALGDGHLDYKEFTFTNHLNEKDYMNYIKDMIMILFGLNSKIFLGSKDKKAIVMDTYSKALVNFLSKNGLKIGNKIKNKARLPGWVFENKRYSSAALRGLFDTDGGIYHKEKKYKRAIIEFQTNSPSIHNDILKLLSILNFTPSKGNNGKKALDLRIQNQNEVHAFFQVVGSSNPKNILKYNIFTKEGYVPLSKEIESLLPHFKKEMLPFKAR